VVTARPLSAIDPARPRTPDYVASLWLISFALIFDLDSGMLHRLLKCIGNEGKDVLYEYLLVTRVVGRKEATDLAYPKIYEPLYKAITATGAARDELVKKFLAGWYKNMKAAYWHDCHKGRDGGGFFLATGPSK